MIPERPPRRTANLALRRRGVTHAPEGGIALLSQLLVELELRHTLEPSATSANPDRAPHEKRDREREREVEREVERGVERGGHDDRHTITRTTSASAIGRIG